jgi:hypothetical protein
MKRIFQYLFIVIQLCISGCFSTKPTFEYLNQDKKIDVYVHKTSFAEDLFYINFNAKAEKRIAQNLLQKIDKLSLTADQAVDILSSKIKVNGLINEGGILYTGRFYVIHGVETGNYGFYRTVEVTKYKEDNALISLDFSHVEQVLIHEDRLYFSGICFSFNGYEASLTLGKKDQPFILNLNNDDFDKFLKSLILLCPNMRIFSIEAGKKYL